jgi:hypothetical protein
MALRLKYVEWPYMAHGRAMCVVAGRSIKRLHKHGAQESVPDSRAKGQAVGASIFARLENFGFSHGYFQVLRFERKIREDRTRNTLKYRSYNGYI